MFPALKSSPGERQLRRLFGNPLWRAYTQTALLMFFLSRSFSFVDVGACTSVVVCKGNTLRRAGLLRSVGVCGCFLFSCSRGSVRLRPGEATGRTRRFKFFLIVSFPCSRFTSGGAATDAGTSGSLLKWASPRRITRLINLVKARGRLQIRTRLAHVFRVVVVVLFARIHRASPEAAARDTGATTKEGVACVRGHARHCFPALALLAPSVFLLSEGAKF